jgi:type II secretion system protein L
MARGGAFLLALEAETWRVARIGGDGVKVRQMPRDEQSAAALKEALGEWGYDGRGVCLGLPSELVLAASILLEGLPRKRRRTAMLYRLEEQLPLEAERFTADFIPCPGGRSLGLAVETRRVREILDTLQDAGIEVAAICPTALLALQDALGSAGGEGYALVATPAGRNVFRLAANGPAAWYTSTNGTTDLVRHLQVDSLNRPIEVDAASLLVVGPWSDQETSALQESSALEVSSGPDDAIVAAARSAKVLLDGRPAGWVDFRRDGLAAGNPWGRLGGLLRPAAVLGCVLLTVLTVSFLWRAGRFEAVAETHEQKQTVEFRKLYPTGAVPPNVKSRLQSERRRLAARSGTGMILPTQSSALDALRAVTTNLPRTMRLRIIEIRIEPTGVFMEGQTRSFSDAEAVSQAVQRGGFEVEPPRTEKLAAGGVSFSLFAKPAAAESQGDQP